MVGMGKDSGLALRVQKQGYTFSKAQILCCFDRERRGFVQDAST